MFVFTLDAFWNELVSGAPGIAEVFKEIGKFSGSEYIRNIHIILNNDEVKKSIHLLQKTLLTML